MENNKEIGKAFREKLDQLDRTPNDALWSKIDRDLDSKKKKRPVFWFIPLSILSGLLLGGLSYIYLTGNNGVSNPENAMQNEVVRRESQEKNKIAATSTERRNASTERNNTFTEGKNAFTERKNTFTERKNASTERKNASTERKSASTEGKNAFTERKNTFTEGKNAFTEGKNASTEGKNAFTEGKNAFTERKNTFTEGKNASTERKSASTEGKNAFTERKNTFTEGKSASTEGKKALSEPKKTIAGQKKTPTEGNKTKTGNSNASYKTVPYSEQTRTIKKTKRLIKSTDEYDEYEVVQKYTYVVKKKKKTFHVPNKKTYHSKNKNQSHFSKNKRTLKKPLKSDQKITNKTEFALIENKKDSPEIIETKTDSVIVPEPVAIVEPKIIPKKKLKKTIPEDSVKIEIQKKRNIYISPYFGPTHYESFGKGNSVSGQYKNDKKKGALTYSYGCYVRWMFDDKIGSRTGVGKTNLEYVTNIRKSRHDFIDTKNINLVSSMTSEEINTQFENDSEVIMTQKLSYYEVPLEAYYVLRDRKIGVATSFGFSFLFLDENELTLKSNSVNEYKIGSAKNVLSQSITGNLRLILDYKLAKSLRLEVSPSFQYHAIGFKNVSDFKPYILTLQAGFSYRF
ncbi:hypothetical protein [Flavobacterium sp.]|uniref:hypothetical protein n=1 Tax=Flavobacterium sp. TaxID=239 RepID=UPI003D6C1FB1